MRLTGTVWSRWVSTDTMQCAPPPPQCLGMTAQWAWPAMSTTARWYRLQQRWVTKNNIELWVPRNNIEVSIMGKNIESWVTRNNIELCVMRNNIELSITGKIIESWVTRNNIELWVMRNSIESWAMRNDAGLHSLT